MIHEFQQHSNERYPNSCGYCGRVRNHPVHNINKDPRAIIKMREYLELEKQTKSKQ